MSQLSIRQLRKTLAEFDSPRHSTLCVSDQLRVPTAIGFIKPLVVIPAWTMQELSTPELNTILLHELAHLRRRDDWTNLVQKIVGSAVVLPSRGLVDREETCARTRDGVR